MESYDLINKQLKSLIEDEINHLSNLCNAVAFLYDAMDDINWLGVYLLKEDSLFVGPFIGKPACVKIPVGKGVCGKCAQTKKALIVSDVHKFEGHIACDSRSNSEIVIPIMKDNCLLGVLDIDSENYARFNEQDLKGLKDSVDMITDHIKFDF